MDLREYRNEKARKDAEEEMRWEDEKKELTSEQMDAIDSFAQGLRDVFTSWQKSENPHNEYAGLKAESILMLHWELARMRFDLYTKRMERYLAQQLKDLKKQTEGGEKAC